MLETKDLRPATSRTSEIASKPTKLDRVADRVARRLAVWLLDRKPPEGAGLPPESELVAQMGCSRTTLRHALRRLESWGLISMHMGRNGGALVRSPRAADMTDVLAILMHVRAATFQDLLVARRTIDPVIAAEAARNREASHVIALKDVLEGMRRDVRFDDLFFAGSQEFSRVLAEASGAVMLGLIMDALVAIGSSSLLERLPIDSGRSIRQLEAYERIADAIAASDPVAAQAEMSAYRLESERLWRVEAPNLIDLPWRPFDRAARD